MKKYFGWALALIVLVGLGWYTNDIIKISRYLVVGDAQVGRATFHGRTTTEDTVVIRGIASQTADLLQLETSAGAAVFSVGPAGQLSVTGVAADPCTSATYAGRVFWNSTNKRLCYCGGDDGSTDLIVNTANACF